MFKWVKFYNSQDNTYVTYFTDSKVLQNDGETHQFTSPEDAIAHGTVEEYVFWDNNPIGAGTQSAAVAPVEEAVA